MTSSGLMRFERQRRYATLVALALEGTATITDEVIGLHEIPAAKPVLEAIELLREMNAGGIRELPD